MRTTTRVRKHFAHRPLAIAAAITLLVGASLPARAQSVSASGDVFPVIVTAPVVDLTGERIFLGFTNAGIGTSGSLSITGGGSLTAAQIVPGIGGLGVGTVSVSGAGSIINLTGGAAFNGLDIGSWGTGTVTVSNGGSIACASTLACQFNDIGNAAGSTGTLAINGGSVSGLGQLFVGSGRLQAGFGTLGADTTATLTITNGGTLATTGSSSVAFNSGQTGLVTGNVTIDGAGSQWAITRDLANGGGQAFLSLAQTANSVANVTIGNGGNLTITGSDPSTNNSLPGFNMSAGAGGTSTMTVTTGGSIVIGGNTGVANVGGASGASSLGATATLNITAGGTVTGEGPNGLAFMSIGRNQASGTVNVSGGGSQLVLGGVGGLGTGSDGTGATLNVGRVQGFGGGTGTLNVTNGGSVLISDNGQAATNGGVALRVGREAGSTGTVLVSGPGSSIVVSSTGGGTAVPGVRVGEGGTGQMTISNGGSVSVLGSGQRNFLVGQGSTGSGTLNVTTGGQINASWFGVGNEGGSGIATINNATVNLDGFVDFNTGVGAALRVGRGVGSTGVLNLQNGAAINIANSLPDSAVLLGGTSVAPGGTGTINMSGGSTITFTGTATGATLAIGGSSGGNGLMSMTGSSIVDTGATGALQVGSSTGSSGNLTIGGGSQIFANTAGIGGSSDTNVGGIGNAVITGAGSQLKLAGDSGFLGVGRNGTGSLTVSSQGEVAATIINVGRAAGGVGTMSVDNGIINLSGQQTSGSQSGASLGIGTLGGTGTVNITNNSVVTITNTGSAGASLNLGGTPLTPLGTGTLTVSNSTINVIAAPGQAIARIGHDGTGTATLTGSTLGVVGGQLIIAGQPGSTGTLTLNAGSVVNADYVGVGATPTGLPPGTYTPQNPGGTGRLIINDSTVNAASTFEVGALGFVGGNNGVINVGNRNVDIGDVIVGGTISPGESPGRLRINCNLISLDGSKLILEIQDNGDGGYNIDQLIIGNDSTFDLAQFQIVFTFLGDTDPTAFADSGGFDLDNFLLAGSFNGDPDAALSTVFATDDTWDDVVDFDRISAVSSVFDITSLEFNSEGVAEVVAAPIPEPSTWALILVGLWFVASSARKLRRGPSALAPQGHVTACS